MLCANLKFVIASEGDPALAGFAACEAIQSFLAAKKDWIASSHMVLDNEDHMLLAMTARHPPSASMVTLRLV